MLKERADTGFRLALGEAERSVTEGGIPIGAVLLDEQGLVLAAAHNERVQRDDPMLHAEIVCLSNAGRRHGYGGTVLFSTLMPCYMCAGAVVQFGIPRVVVGESRTFSGAHEFLREHGVEVVDLDDIVPRALLSGFIKQHPDVWGEDIGVNI